jgi:endonuclease YncB( thermonuclease family)
VVDGDTLKVDGVSPIGYGESTHPNRASLAPTDGQPGGLPPNTSAPSSATAMLLANPGRTLDRYGRTVAICRADGRDLGADMVSDGHAWAFVRYSRDYVEEEREAAAVRAGIHGHTCQPAWQWRSERRKNQPIMLIGP